MKKIFSNFLKTDEISIWVLQQLNDARDPIFYILLLKPNIISEKFELYLRLLVFWGAISDNMMISYLIIFF